MLLRKFLSFLRYVLIIAKQIDLVLVTDVDGIVLKATLCDKLKMINIIAILHVCSSYFRYYFFVSRKWLFKHYSVW